MTTMSSKIGQDQPTVTVEPVKGIVSTTTTTTIPAGTSIPMMDEEKMGGKCCGCCCDFRRAVIICNIILLVFAIIGFILVISGNTVDTDYSLDDDSAYDTYFAIEIVTLIITILMNICAILGAIKYNIGMVVGPAIWYLVEYIITIANAFIYCSAWEEELEETGFYVNAECTVPPVWIVGALVVTLIWIYPHIGFVKEVKAGTMSQETYPREEFSCCCVA